MAQGPTNQHDDKKGNFFFFSMQNNANGKHNEI